MLETETRDDERGGARAGWWLSEFDVSFNWDRMEPPESGSGGGRPKTNDFRTTVGLAIDYRGFEGATGPEVRLGT